MDHTIISYLKKLFENWAGHIPTEVQKLAGAGSDRQYYRLRSDKKSAIGTYAPHKKEFWAFISFSEHFYKEGVLVPEVYAYRPEQQVYLQQDLGDTRLYDVLPNGEPFSPSLVDVYKKALEKLAFMQIVGGEGLDYDRCYPRAAFDRQSMLWDLNLFKYYFLNLSGVSFDEQALEDDFHALTDYLLQADSTHFMFRDFQSRNILIHKDQPYFIDYQGGRRGALQYDVVSLLFQAKANLSADLRATLLSHYIEVAQTYTYIDEAVFRGYYNGYVLMRTLQVLGAYGRRGLYEGKAHFVKSIPFAIANLKQWLDTTSLPVVLSCLEEVLHKLVENPKFVLFPSEKVVNNPLCVRITSFSYKKGIPQDASGNGGGFVFDCRAIHNPGRYEAHKEQTGRDAEVIRFFEEKTNMRDFIHKTINIVENSVENYIARGFTSLVVNFGCTGGQHRSVYAADQLAHHLKTKYGIRVELLHRERGWPEEVL